MILVAAGPHRHVAGITCWCRPRPLQTADQGWVWVHRNVTLRPDVQPRAFQSVNLSPPA